MPQIAIKSSAVDKLKTEWQTVRLGDVCRLQAGSAFNLAYQGQSVGMYPFIKVSDMNLPGNEIHIRVANNWISDDVLKAIRAKLHPAGATAFAKIGIALTYNRRRLLTRETIVDNNMMSAIPKEGIVNSRFLYYLLCQVDFNKIVEGSALPYLNTRTIEQMEVSVPSLQRQHSIASILGSLDDKIELNRQMNETLEQTAQALFKSWFVDFEFPVEAPLPPKGGVGEYGEVWGAGRPRVLGSANPKIYAALEQKAKEMRTAPTAAESALWGRLRGNALGVKFRRQHVIDRFIVDFYCVEKGIVIEVDGGVHETRREQDEDRESHLEALGCRVLRFSNEQVLHEIDAVIDEIKEALTKPLNPLTGHSYPLKEEFEIPFRGKGAPIGYKSSGGEMMDSALGEIPKGWKVGEIKDLGKVICGKTPPTADEVNYGTDVPFVTIPDMHGKTFITKTGKGLSNKGALIQPTKTLPTYSVCVSCIATPGLVALTSKECQTNQQINSIVPNETPGALYSFLVLRGLGDKIRSHGSGGSVLLNLSKGRFESLPVLIPSDTTAKEFNTLVKSIFDQILKTELESSTLATLRDTLLPMLFSGEIKIS